MAKKRRVRDPLSGVAFGPEGLVPVIVQHAETGEVRMQAYADREALARTLATGEAHFWSRSRRTLWKKGETSGNTLRVVEAFIDCDGDSILLKALPKGPTCHTGAPSCFHSPLRLARRARARAAAPATGDFLDHLEAVIADRKAHPKKGSYTTSLLAGGKNAVARKVMEEAFEVVMAAWSEGHDRTVSEAADLVYHLLVLLADAGVSLAEVRSELERRHR